MVQDQVVGLVVYLYLKILTLAKPSIECLQSVIINKMLSVDRRNVLIFDAMMRSYILKDRRETITFYKETPVIVIEKLNYGAPEQVV